MISITSLFMMVVAVGGSALVESLPSIENDLNSLTTSLKDAQEALAVIDYETNLLDELLDQEEDSQDETPEHYKKPQHGGITWDYGKHGPKTWGAMEANCHGSSQSPIAIVTSETAKGKRSNRVLNHNYAEEVTGTYTIKNNGHALQIDLPSNTAYELKKGDDQKYIPLQAHIHFDPFTGNGSEHTLNGKKYFAEIHIVHRNSKYNTSHEYMANSDGLFVIGIFVDLAEKDWKKDSIHVFGDAASKLSKSGDNIQIPAFPLADLLPRHRRRGAKFGYVNYKGSLTTPTCNEIVDWVVITGRTVHASEKTANQFKSVLNSHGKAMAGNNRPVQALNGRTVYRVKGKL